MPEPSRPSTPTIVGPSRSGAAGPVQLHAAEDRLRALITRVAKRDVNTADLDTRWRDLGIDSLDLLAIVLDCEREFAVTIPDDQTMGFATIRDILSFVSAAHREP
jgi:acyl carrier protein